MGSLLQVISRGGVAMYPLLLCSVLAVAVTLERAGVIGRARVNAGSFVARLRELVQHGDLEGASELCAATRAPLGPVATAGLAKVGRSAREIEDAMAHAGSLAIQDLESNLPILGTIGSTAPFIGLFGTVLGIMRSFHNIQLQGHAGTAVVAGGVSEALIATAAGLVVSVLSIISYNTFLNRITRLEAHLEAAQSELLYVFTEDAKCARRDESVMHAEVA